MGEIVSFASTGVTSYRFSLSLSQTTSSLLSSDHLHWWSCSPVPGTESRAALELEELDALFYRAGF